MNNPGDIIIVELPTEVTVKEIDYKSGRLVVTWFDAKDRLHQALVSPHDTLKLDPTLKESE